MTQSRWHVAACAAVCGSLVAASAARAGAPFDLVWDSVDDNGFPRNPRWAKQDAYFKAHTGSHGWERASQPDILTDCLNFAEAKDPANIGTLNDGYNPFQNGYARTSGQQCGRFTWLDNPWAGKCTVLGSEDSPDNIGGNGGFLRKWHIDGHVNFQVVNFDGVVRWDNAQSEDDWDYDWCTDLYTPNGFGVANRDDHEVWVHTEFNPQELGDNFDFGFWQRFRDNVHQGQAAPGAQSKLHFFGDDRHWGRTKAAQDRLVAPMINGKRAIVIGLLNLDVGHNAAGAELHPVLGQAVHVGGRTLAGIDCKWTPRATTPQEQAGCDANQELDAGLCYTQCKPGFHGVGPVCWENCRAGFHDDGATCRLDASIVGKPSYGRGVGSVPGRTCAAGSQMDAGLCYPACRAGFHPVGPVCWGQCPAGYNDDGATCRRDAHIISADNSRCPWYDKCGLVSAKGCSTCPPNQGYSNDGCTCRRDVSITGKSSYGRGAGQVPSPTCGAGQLDAGLCYPACRAGYHGVGPVCWGQCPAGYKDDGATCRKDVEIYAKSSYGRGVGTIPNGPPPSEWCEYDEAPYQNWTDNPTFDVVDNEADDSWAMFATSFGSQGYCSTKEPHVLTGPQSIIGQPGFARMTFRLPWARDRAGNEMADVEILPTTQFKQESAQGDMTIQVVRSGQRAVLVSFPLQSTNQRALWFGELHLKWHRDPKSSGEMAAAPRRAAIAAAMRAPEPHPWASHLSADQKAKIAQQYPAAPPPFVHAPSPAKPRVVTAPPPRPPARTGHVPPAAKPTSPHVIDDDTKLRGALCAAHAGKLPGAPPDYCAKLPTGRP